MDPPRNAGHQRNDGQWEGFREYMGEKTRKLNDQFENIDVAPKSRIFEGVSIHVNGHTDPPTEILRLRMREHGGIYQMYRDNTTTHIIASNLCGSKLHNLSDKDLVVKPQWITDCVAAGRLLPVHKYRLGKRGASEAAFNTFLCSGSGPMAAKSTRLSSNAPQLQTTSKDIDHANTQKTNNSDLNELPSHSVSTAPLKTTDPNFLSDYYARSRLHFISTWAQEMKDYVQRLKDESNGSFAHRERIKTYERSMLSERDLQLHDSSNWSRDESVYMHIDMDCFFVSVILRDKPELLGSPVVVTHAKSNTSNTSSSFAEIASCSYEARKFGLKNGMLLCKAKALCPQLQAVAYDFQGYDQVSRQLYTIICGYTLDVEAVSCDELYVNIQPVCVALHKHPVLVALCIREHIRSDTGCAASAGMGPNLLVARLATRQAKPNGQFHVTNQDREQFMLTQRLADLPGIGRQTLEKIHSIYGTDCVLCSHLQAKAPLPKLMQHLGQKTGRQLFDACRGIDDRKLNVKHERKSVSCDINYGIRITQASEAHIFLENLTKEVCKKLNQAKVKGKSITLRILTRSADAPINPAKYLGCGKCDAATKSHSFDQSTDSYEKMIVVVRALFQSINPVVADMRGVSLAMHKLQSTNCIDKHPTHSTKPLHSFFGPHSNRLTTLDQAQRVILSNNGSPSEASTSAIEQKQNKMMIATNPVVNEASGLMPSIYNSFVSAAFADDLPFVDWEDSDGVNESVDDDEDDVIILPGPSGTTPSLCPTAKSTDQQNILQAQAKSLSQLDQSVLSALPSDIQNEVIQFYGRSKVIQPAAKLDKPLSVGRGQSRSSSWSKSKTGPSTKSSDNQSFGRYASDNMLTLSQTWGGRPRQSASKATFLGGNVGKPTTSADSCRSTNIEMHSDNECIIISDEDGDISFDNEPEQPSADVHQLWLCLAEHLEHDFELDVNEQSSIKEYLVSQVQTAGGLSNVTYFMQQLKTLKCSQQNWELDVFCDDLESHIQSAAKQEFGDNAFLVI